MDLKKLFMNNKAVSPVIGVILMVAITVILAAAIGSSVFGQGTAQSAPQANLNIQANGVPTDAGLATIKIEHLGGDPINFDIDVTKIMVSIDGGDSEQVSPGSITTISVGDVKKLDIKDTSSTPAVIAIAPGNTVNIKVIDIATSQLICDKDIRF
ncbi:type IV pilin [Methanosarcina sp. MSH10X1]|uniref:type IV pilin n=1 Tax=Methanosarcina sp. MSH10X1 TaxID=2507075 RepID=UPI000FFC15E9|nr:type IV pilin [Methanosarcina sp. MSH10X1]RXA21342.1 type IV pilin [Methanosarcina sp. MSH10X1]